VIRLLIADEHAIVRSGLNKIFSAEANLSVVGEAENGTQVLERFRTLEFDLLLLDLNMPGPSGPDLIARLKSQYPRIPILVLSMHNTVQVATKALKAGASGYVTKDSDPELLIQAVQKVAAGGKYMSPALADKMLFGEPSPDPSVATVKLSDREMDVFRGMVRGHSLNDIASALHISSKTVSTHKSRLMDKLHVSSTAEIVLYAVNHGLLE
jgi:DNA-binding NarL/FixJ family response regulator